MSSAAAFSPLGLIEHQDIDKVYRLENRTRLIELHPKSREVAGFIDGQRTVGQIIQEAKISTTKALSLIGQLLQGGFLISITPMESAAEEAAPAAASANELPSAEDLLSMVDLLPAEELQPAGEPQPAVELQPAEEIAKKVGAAWINGGKRLSRLQLQVIRSMSRNLDKSSVQIRHQSLQIFGVPPEELSPDDATSFISLLREEVRKAFA